MGKMAGLAYKNATRDPPFLMQNDCDSSPFDHKSTLMNHSIVTAKIVLHTKSFFF